MSVEIKKPNQNLIYICLFQVEMSKPNSKAGTPAKPGSPTKANQDTKEPEEKVLELLEEDDEFEEFEGKYVNIHLGHSTPFSFFIILILTLTLFK